MIVFLLAGLGALLPVLAAADDAMDARHLAERATQSLENFSQAPEMDAFRSLLKDARGVFIAPQILKGAFFVGASGGSGVLVARDSLTGALDGPCVLHDRRGELRLSVRRQRIRGGAPCNDRPGRERDAREQH